MITFEDIEGFATKHALNPKYPMDPREWLSFSVAIHECLLQNERRPCSIKNKTGYTFLRWVVEKSPPAGEYPWDYKGEFATRTYGLVEDPYGNVIKVRPEKIRFDEKV